jgi:LDH2 family malate/lactate/ureidoglycolate dehydrogenase
MPWQGFDLMTARYAAQDLTVAARTLFEKAGASTPVAQAMADILVEADLLGYSTHGLQFVPAYLAAMEGGKTTTAGEPEIVIDNGSALVLDGKGLPGQWVMLRALDLGFARAKDDPMVGMAIRNTANISCLATYARRAALKGYLAIVAASAPATKAVAPFGGATPVIGTNPFAVGMPGADHPILIDTSASAVTNRAIERAQRLGERLPFPALVAADGTVSDDPACLKTDPPGAIRPAGGDEAGHKGFAMGLLVEVLTSGLAGLGRSSAKPPAGNTVYLQLIDPRGFAGADAFTEETGVLADLCRAATPRDPANPVRVPGDRAAAAYAEQSAKGVALHPEIIARMQPLLEKYGIPAPKALK